MNERDPFSQKKGGFQKHKKPLTLLDLSCRLCPWGGGTESTIVLGVGGSMLDAPRNVIIEILYQVPVCLSWRA